MIRNVLEHINGIAILPIIGLILFFAVFTVMIIWAVRLRRPYVDHMGHLPLENDHEISSKENPQ
ncbi:MAG TPA: cbb3-type cytochrome c oxidase subunit 3 [Kiritimatiellia bacterium]|nr:cbb3-type cytochrome c oxidase subunit 3 [Kiritimatiellia bacterium]